MDVMGMALRRLRVVHTDVAAVWLAGNVSVGHDERRAKGVRRE
jgi:hypothetical protein